MQQENNNQFDFYDDEDCIVVITENWEDVFGMTVDDFEENPFEDTVEILSSLDAVEAAMIEDLDQWIERFGSISE
jgi:hypothetical protein